MRKLIVLMAVMLLGCGSLDSSPTWKVVSTNDPVTGIRRCVVTAADRIADDYFTRMGFLYPFVERNSQFGLLVGVSSGGRIRIPVGDILWRVDSRPYRKLRAINNPVSSSNPTVDSFENETPNAIRDSVALASRMAQAAMSTSTATDGYNAQSMLDEMKSGRTLIFRSAHVASDYGLPDQAASAVGQYRNGELQPIPLDESFHAGLRTCRISR